MAYNTAMIHKARGLFTCLFLGFIIQLNAQSYWVGGSGDWQDPSHWAGTSGGFGGTGLTPNAVTDAIFDQNSFPAGGGTVTILNAASANQAACRDLIMADVTNNPIITAENPSTQLEIYGSMTLSPNMTWDYFAELQFRATQAGKTITTAGQSFDGPIIFEGINGEWTLQDGWDAENVMELQAGALYLNGNGITPSSFIVRSSTSGAEQLLNIENSSMLLIGGSTNELILESDDLILEASGSGIALDGPNTLVSLDGNVDLTLGSVSFLSGSSILQNNGNGRRIYDSAQFFEDGAIYGSCVLNTIILANGHTVVVENGNNMDIAEFQTSPDECIGDALFVSENVGGPRVNVNWFAIRSQSSAGVYFRGIAFDQRVTFFNGFDGGDNVNLDANGIGRILYWVGDGGDWYDTNNWSETSGGLGGACVPKTVDNVIFDDNSFPGGLSNQEVISDRAITLNSFLFDYMGPRVAIQMPSLTIVADGANNNPVTEPALELLQRVDWGIDDVFVYSPDRPGATCQTDNIKINSPFQALFNLTLSGETEGRVCLSGDLNVLNKLTILGPAKFSTSDCNGNTFDIQATRFGAYDGISEFVLDGSTITIFDNIIENDNTNNQYPVYINDVNNVSAVGTRWEFQGDSPGFRADMGAFGSLYFPASPGSGATIFSDGDISFTTAQFLSNGRYDGGQITFDSLILVPISTALVSPVSVSNHVFENDVDVTINEYFEALAESCALIRLSSRGNSTNNLNINSTADIDNLRFLVIEDLTATGGPFYAGDGSTGMGTTSGWTFPTQQEIDDIFEFMGRDTFACADMGIEFGPFTGSGFEWEVNGAMSSTATPSFTLDVNTPNVNSDSDNEVILTIITDAGCELTDTAVVSLGEPIMLSAALNTVDNFCQGGSLPLDPGYNEADATFLWSTGETTPTIEATTTDIYSVEVERRGCSATSNPLSVQEITLERYPDIFYELSDTILCETDGFSIAFTPNRSGTSYTWNDGSSDPQIDINPTTRPVDGYYWIQISEGDCTDSDSILVNFDPEITQVLPDDTDTVICAGDEFDLQTVAGFDSVLWSTGDITPSITVNSADTYMVTAYTGACQADAQRGVTVTDIGVVALDEDAKTICSLDDLDIAKPQSVTFSHEWLLESDSSSLGTDDTLRGPVIPGMTTGYVLAVTEGLCSIYDTIQVTVDVAPDVSTLPSPGVTICQGVTELLSVPLESDITYQWSRQSNGNSVSTTNELTVSDADIFVLDASRGVCDVQATVDVSVLDITAIDLGPQDTTLCEDSPLMLDATLPGVTYQWSGQNLSTDPIITATTSGQYKVTVSAAQCEASDSIQVTFEPAIRFQLHDQGDSTICDNDEIAYNVNLNNATITWTDLNENVLTTGGVFSFDQEDTYIINIERGRCRLSDTLAVTTIASPVIPPLTTDPTACEGEIINLDAMTSPTDIFLWDDADGTTSRTLSVTSSGTYTVQVTELLSGLNCTSSASETVTFNPLPTITNTYDDIAECQGDSALVDLDLGALDVVLNSINNGQVSGETSVYLKNQDQYTLVATDDNGCSSEVSFNFIANPRPQINLTQDTVFLCDGDPRTINATSSGPTPDFIEWHNGSNDPEYTITVADNEIFATAFIVTNGEQCIASDTAQVRNVTTPNYSIPSTATICSDSTLIVDSGVTGANINWSTGETTPSIQITETGIYQIMVDVKGCFAPNQQIDVTVNPVPDIQLSMDTTICADDMIEIAVTNIGTADVTWSTGETTETISVGAGEYSVTADDNGCTTEMMIFIDSVSLPVFNLGADTSICGMAGIQLSVDVPNVDVQWSTGQSGNNIMTTELGLITATATTTEGCVYTDDIRLSERTCSRFNLDDIPNVFSPSLAQDVRNKVFTINAPDLVTVHNFTMKIYNRWGNLVYESNDIDTGWDGNTEADGNTLNPGVYVYMIEITYSDDFDTNLTDVYHGSVTLID